MDNQFERSINQDPGGLQTISDFVTTPQNILDGTTTLVAPAGAVNPLALNLPSAVSHPGQSITIINNSAAIHTATGVGGDTVQTSGAVAAGQTNTFVSDGVSLWARVLT